MRYYTIPISVTLFFVIVIFALTTTLKQIDGFKASAIIGFFVAFMLSSFGLPMTAALILAKFGGLGYWLQDEVYGL